MNQWLIVELSSRADGEDPDEISRALRGAVRGAEVFIPATVTQVRGDRTVHYLVEGYAFVRRTKPDAAYRPLSSCRYVQSLLVDPAKHTLATVSETEIEKFRKQMSTEVDQGICVDDIVKITAGPYKELIAKVIEEYPETQTVQVYIRLLSKEAIITLPRSFLQLEVRKEVSPTEAKIRGFRLWLRMAKGLAYWTVQASDSMVQSLGATQKLSLWQAHGSRLFDFVRAYTAPPQPARLLQSLEQWQWLSGKVQHIEHTQGLIHELGQKDLHLPSTLKSSLGHWQTLSDWRKRSSKLFDFISVYYKDIKNPSIEPVYSKWASLVEKERKLNLLSKEISQIQTQISLEESTMFDNVLIDGFNLAFRCRYAPGIADLTDSKGRPTGIIFGFLRSLAALKRRYKTSQIHVCWDGSSQQRKEMFADYKANRPERATESFDQIGFLRAVLPMLGVTQAWNPQEEADDVLATLVRGSLEKQRNVILSTDRDLLQLVTPTTIVLIPESGGRKEIFFDEDKVKEDYGVSPEFMPHLRAMVGDTSDNIPGVSRVPSKILSALVRSYGTVDCIFSSGLPGLTRSQYQKLRDAEAQVKLNVSLMSLRTVSVTQIEPNPDQKAALARLQDVDIKPDVVASFFEVTKGFVKESVQPTP